MIYGEINGLNKPVSRLIFGCATNDMMSGKDNSELLNFAFQNGINTFDLARVYGKSENSFGEWLKTQDREKVVIESKGCHPGLFYMDRITEKALKKDITDSLNALGTPYVDIYLLHRDNLKVPVGDVVQMLNSLKAEGKVKVFGGSNWTVQRIEQANEYAYSHNLTPFAVSSPSYSLAVTVNSPWGKHCVTLSGKEKEGDRQWYVKNQMPIFAYSSLARGFMAGAVKSETRDISKLDKFAVKAYNTPNNFLRLQRAEEVAKALNCTLSQVALAWLLSQSVTVYPVISASKEKRIADNIKSVEVCLTDEQIKYLSEV